MKGRAFIDQLRQKADAMRLNASMAYADEYDLLADAVGEAERLKANRDYWHKSCQQAQEHRDGANAQLDIAYKEIERLREALAKIATWRDGARAYDADVGNPERMFCEDVELIEEAASCALAQKEKP